MMCLWASITWRAELRSMRWKPTKREAVSDPSSLNVEPVGDDEQQVGHDEGGPSGDCAIWSI